MRKELTSQEIAGIVTRFETILKNKKMSPRTVTTYAFVARALLENRLDAATITSKSRLLQAKAVASKLRLYKLIENDENFDLPPRFETDIDPTQYLNDRYVAEADFKRFLEALPKTKKGRELHLLCRLIYAGGFRLQEGLNLKTENFQNGKMIVVMFRGKRGKARKTRLPLKFRKDLVKFKGFSIRYEYARDMTRKIMAKVGIKSSIHGLRHSFATNLAKSGVPVNVIKDLMGHSSLEVTARYLHFIDDDCPELERLGY